MFKKLFIVLTSLLINFSILAIPTEIIVTTANPQGWMIQNNRADSSVNITTNRPRSGNGSLEFVTNFATPGQDKIDYELAWDPTVFTNRTLSNLSNLSYEYYRDSAGSTVPAHFHPVLRLGWYNDAGTPANTIDDTYGQLVYEEIYQGVNPVPVDSWDINTINLNTHNFWMYCGFCIGGASGIVQNYGVTLQDWKAGPIVGIGADPVPPNLSQGTTYLFSVNTGIGSGWGADVLMWVDNINIGFGISDDFIYNFEVLAPTAVPIFNKFGLMAMMFALLLLMLILQRKTKE